jgi:ribosomal protein S18 acetylase RimI-like enzyme
MGIKIRPGRTGDAPFLAWVILTSGRGQGKRGIWEIAIQGTEKECLAFLELVTVTEKLHLFHHSCYLVAESNGLPVAALAGYDPKVLGYDALREALPEVFKKIGLDGGAGTMNETAAQVLDCIPEEIDGAWIIESVATLPDFRRRGLVDRLLEETMQQARKKGFRLAQINIYIGNTPAQRAYEKHGFKVLDEKRDPVFESEIGSPGMARLWRDL